MQAIKKIAFALFTLLLCMSLFVLPSVAVAADSTDLVNQSKTGNYVFDEQGLFSSSEFADLEAKGAELATAYDMGVYFLTTDYMNGLSDPTSSQRTDYATTYYKNHSLGLNPTDGKAYGDGIMFVIATNSRDYITVAYGQGSYSFGDAGIEAMEEAVLDNIKDHKDNWYGAATTYYAEIGKQLAYYESHGKAMKPLSMSDYAFRFAIFLGIPFVVAYFIIRKWKSDMKTAVQKSEAGNYLDNNSVVVTHSHDKFVNTTRVVTPKPKDKGSSGGWGGGGGGGFSSSGGGKF